MLSRLEDSGRDLAIIRAVANAETSFVAFVRYAAALMQRLDVPARTRELIIMYCAAKQQIGYEWAEHYGVAISEDVTAEELRALEKGSIPESVSDLERLYLRATEELLDWRQGARGAHDQLRELRGQLDDRKFSEFALIVGWWAGCVPLIIETLGLDSDRPPIPSGE
jgi:alkylhydroperoxidase family enzyme